MISRWSTVWHSLHHPLYAGAYAYGRRPARRGGRPAPPGSRPRALTDPQTWEVLLLDRYPAYITWDHYLANLRRLQDMGHQAVLIVGDYTATVGDPSGKDKTRPMLTLAQVEARICRFSMAGTTKPNASSGCGMASRGQTNVAVAAEA